MPIKKAVEIQGEIDDQHRLHADVPHDLPVGSVRVIVLISEEDEGGPAKDIYTLNDGQPIDTPR